MEKEAREVQIKARTRIALCAVVLLLGAGGMIGLAHMKKPPAEVGVQERPIRVEAVRVEAEDVPVWIEGYGEVQALDVVGLSPEVAGTIVEIHPHLEVGETIPKGDLLFRIDPRDYELASRKARASVRQWETSIQQLEKRLAIDRERLKTLQRSRDLARKEFERVRALFEQAKVGTQSGVDAAERASNAAEDQVDLMEQAVLLYPFQIQEAESNLAAARAGEATARVNLERCTVRAPFDARVKAVQLEQGQYVAPGMNVLTLADDSVLEIRVPLDSRDVRKWLRFAPESVPTGTAWFSELEPVPCRIRWTEDPEAHVWEGRLHRVVEFDQQTRTITVAVRVEAEAARSANTRNLPLVEGMFCSVEIPGRSMHAVMRVPRWAVSFKNTVYRAVDGRLQTVPVRVAREQGEEAFVSEGLQAGDVVIVTRLVDPLENALLEISLRDAPAEGAS